MALAYIPPGVTVDEVTAPSFSPLLADPTSICIVGPARGHSNYTEVVTLVDNGVHTLQTTNPNISTISVVTAADPTLDAFVADDEVGGIDYDYRIDDSLLSTTGVVTINRSMQTLIADGEEVVSYHEDDDTINPIVGQTQLVTLDRTNGVLIGTTVDSQLSSVSIQNQGNVSGSDYTIVDAGLPGASIAWTNFASTTIQRYQTVYVDYTIGTTDYKDLAVTLNDTTPVALPANSISHVVKNAPGDHTDFADEYQQGTGTDLDYLASGGGQLLQVRRATGTTTMGVTEDELTVKITYQATPTDYYYPTRVFSQGDVEQKYGPAFDSSGNIDSSVSLAASMAFESGASTVVIQALFSNDSGSDVAPTGVVPDWTDTLNRLRSIEDINVLVPLVNTGGLSNSDTQVLSIFQAVQQHIKFMAAMDQFMVAITGEDSTSFGQASATTLRSHATTLGSSTESQSTVLISPANFSRSNPITGINMQIGGQYVAASVAGMLAARPVQATLTRKQVSGINGVNDFRSEAEKNQDATSGLMVVENKNGVIRVRHAVTTDTTSVISRELNVIRAKYFMMESVRDTLDTQVIGNIPADNNASFIVQLLVSNTLEKMVDEGAIVSYRDVQARIITNQPSTIEVRFSYLPSFPLNYIAVLFSIDTSTGEIISDQGQGT